MNKKKTIIAAIVLLLILVVGGAVAYFTDTKTTTNTFTIGNVSIALTEPAFVAENALNKMPGETVAKDPTITNDGNNDAFVFIKVEVPCLGNKELFTYTVNSGWNLLNNGACASNKAVKVYDYGTASALTKLSKNASTPALFNSVTLVNLTNAEATQIGNSNLDIVVTGYGIQADGLSDVTPSGVWSNFA